MMVISAWPPSGRKMLISPVGSAIDLYSLEATFNVFEMISGGWSVKSDFFKSFRVSPVGWILSF